MTARAEVVAAARALVGTPYQHQGRLPGVALDCAGVVICVARACGLIEADFDVTGYTPRPDGTLLAYCDRYLTRIEQDAAGPGDVIVTRFGGEAQHFGILSPYLHGGQAVVHAVTGRGVLETRLLFGTAPAAMKFVAAFRLPGVTA
jgi:cell wall-associated NlpC family hydrolase